MLFRSYYERHLNRMRAIYKSKHDVLLNQLKGLEKDFKIQGEYAGLHILLTSRKGRQEDWLISRAGEGGVKVYGLSSHFIRQAADSRSDTVILGYAKLSEEQIIEGVRRLSRAWKF